MAIIPLRAEFENFLCFQKKQEFIFSHNGIHYIYGIDLDAEVQDGFTIEQYNIGVGKSSLAMLMQFAFYGKIQKKINKNQIINKFTKKNLYIQFDFMINDEFYRIERYRKHHTFGDSLFLWKKINGKLENISHSDRRQTQQEINELIVLDIRTFEKSVLFTRDDKIQFLELPIIERGIIFENIVQINKLHEYLEKVKKKLKNTENELFVINNKILTISTIIKRDKEYIQEIKQNYQNQVNLVTSKIKNIDEQINYIKSTKYTYIEIKELIQQYSILTESNTKLEKEFDVLNADTQNKINNKKFIENKIEEINNKIQKINKKITELAPLKCRVCGAIQNENEYQQIINELKEEIINYNNELNLFNAQLIQNEEIINYNNEKINEITININKNKDIINELLNEIPVFINNPVKFEEINQLYEQLNLYNLQLESLNIDEQIKNIETNIELKNKELKELQLQKNEIMLQKEMLDFWCSVLDFKTQNSLKQYIISKIIPLFNMLLQQIIDAVYLGDMVVTFDNFFQETIIYKNEDTQYEELSTGEKAKLNFCIYLTIFDLTRINLDGSKVVFLDEIFNNIDKPTINNFITIIRERYSKNNGVYIISHQNEVRENLNPDSIIRIEKKNNISTIFIEKNAYFN